MPKSTKSKMVREIEKFAKSLSVDVTFEQCQKHIQVFVAGTCVAAISNGRDTGRDAKDIISKIRQQAKLKA